MSGEDFFDCVCSDSGDFLFCSDGEEFMRRRGFVAFLCDDSADGPRGYEVGVGKMLFAASGGVFSADFFGVGEGQCRLASHGVFCTAYCLEVLEPVVFFVSVDVVDFDVCIRDSMGGYPDDAGDGESFFVSKG